MAPRDRKKVGTVLRQSRPDRHEHFLNLARVVAERSTCLRRKVGAIIVDKEGVELSSGYSGAPRHIQDCLEIGNCLRKELNIESGQNYELCRSVHAEQNAIINAARTGASIVGGVMYISSKKDPKAYPNRRRNTKIYGPCIICKKEIINAGLDKVYMIEEGFGVSIYPIEKIKELLAQEEAKWRNGHKRGKLVPS